jgi:RND family efflux transporter MFP subunit
MVQARTFLPIVLVFCGLVSGCGLQAQGTPKSNPKPSSTDRDVKEDKLNTVKLTEEAEKRIGLETAEVERRAVPRLRSYGGEVALPASALLTVSAPVSGTLKVVKDHELPHVGAVVKKGQPMFTLVPHALTQAEQVSMELAKLQLRSAQIDADGQVEQAKETVDAAKIDYDRFEQLYKNKSVQKKEFDDAKAKLLVAQKALDAAVLKKKLADSMKLDTDAGSVKPLVISSPRDGIVRATFAVAGEMMPAGSPLFEIMNADTVWIKVPIYVGEIGEIADQEPVRVHNLADPPGSAGVRAKPIQAPPTAQAQASSVDLYYELDNKKNNYRPGERVGVLVPLRGQDKSLVVPWSAVVHDIYGGTWVYVQLGTRSYARQRVQVKYVADSTAVLAEGPQVGARVISAGTAEVFGAEFFSK